uniref:Uncharacterized protein n=1 Tax=Glossina palpalis gambiensis TaxID=67801 RepID=A0A1B0BUV9_9MUSC
MTYDLAGNRTMNCVSRILELVQSNYHGLFSIIYYFSRKEVPAEAVVPPKFIWIRAVHVSEGDKLEEDRGRKRIDILRFDNESLNGNDEHVEEFTSLYYYYAKTFESTGSIVSRMESYYRGRTFGKKQHPRTMDAMLMTPLHYAVACGHLECVRLLLEHGAVVNTTNSITCRMLI